MNIYLLLLLLTFVLLQTSSAESGETTTSEGEGAPVDFSKMKTKELKRFLKDRNVVCKGCAEKDDFVKLALESKDLPVKHKPPPPPPKEDKAQIDDLLKKMKEGGLGNMQYFTADDFKDLSPEEMQQKMSGGGFGGGGFAKGGKKRPSPNSKPTKKAFEDAPTRMTDDAEKIEL